MITSKKPKATKCSNHHTISLIAHAAKIGARIIRKRLEKKSKDAWRRSIWIQKRKRNWRCNRDAESVRMYFGHRCKLLKLAKIFSRVSITEIVNNRPLFTKHGLHLNESGKELLLNRSVLHIFSVLEVSVNSITLG